MTNTSSDKNARIYPCADCGTLRSEAEGGKLFTVCDECWAKAYPYSEDKQEARCD